jgi:hypothetical protein
VNSCSGCCEGGEYGSNLHNYEYDKRRHCHIGAGCFECGYTGKRRSEIWMDHDLQEDRAA